VRGECSLVTMAWNLKRMFVRPCLKGGGTLRLAR